MFSAYRQPIGELTRARGRELRFRYEEAWRAAHDSYRLSLSLLLSAAEHGPRAVFRERSLREGLAREVVERMTCSIEAQAARCAKRLG